MNTHYLRNANELLAPIVLLVRQKCLCFYCQVPFVPLTPAQLRMKNYRHIHAAGFTVDHLFPRSKGFTRADAKVLSCYPCNRTKGNRWPTSDEVERYMKIHGPLPLAVLMKAHTMVTRANEQSLVETANG